MDDDLVEGGLNFDFEGGLDAGPSLPQPSGPIVRPEVAGGANNSGFVHGGSDPAQGSYGGGGGGGRRSFRQTVCRHWLRGLCMKGDGCGFLHQYDKTRMPVCRFFKMHGECREQDCVYKHTNEDIKECNMYKLGFCPNGPTCRYRHVKLPGPPPPVEEVFQRMQQLSSYNYGNSNRFFQNRNANFQQAERSQFSQDPNGANQGTNTNSSITESLNMQQQGGGSQQQAGQIQVRNFPNSQQNQGSGTAMTPPQGISRYFIVKSYNRENLELSVQQGVWATQRSNESKLNEAFDSVENVILIFSVNRTRHFQGCAKMASKIGGTTGGGNWKHAFGTANYGRNFSVKWLKLCELSFLNTRHLRNPYNENLPVKISRDCQELEPSIGEQLAALLYLEPDGELMAVSIAAEKKREEEKAKGVDPENGAENPDIVPFEDNEEDEEEESEEEEDEEDEESYDQAFGGAGRGRGRGMMWPPHMPFARGAMPGPQMRGFPPIMMGPIGPNGFPMPDHFGMGPSPFAPYGPRFPGDFAGPASGMMFHGRPPPGGFGMMMGPGRAPFAGAPARPGRPVGMSPMLPPPSQSSQSIKRSQRGTANDTNDRYSGGTDQGKNPEMNGAGPDNETQYKQRVKPQQEENFGSRSSFRNDDSESEDEAPRRTRHGEGKKNRSMEGDAT